MAVLLVTMKTQSTLYVNAALSTEDVLLNKFVSNILLQFLFATNVAMVVVYLISNGFKVFETL